MKKVLYLSNIKVPYRTSFFNNLSRFCDLTVLYERRESSNRDSQWTNIVPDSYHTEYLDGFNIGRESSFSLRIFKIIKREWDLIIVGCYNTKVQMLAILLMKLYGIPYAINLDGEVFVNKGLKGYLKTFFLKGAKVYFVAGIHSTESLKILLGRDIKAVPYYFSSLSDTEIETNGSLSCRREDFVLVVGQYYDYKGMDIALRVAHLDPTIKYKFVGMGKRSSLFVKKMAIIPKNIEIIPFLQKKELEVEYRKCKILLLPSRKECWGLVVNEAASFGTPIVSTFGSGAAIEFLMDNYPQYLSEPGNVESLFKCIKDCLSSDNTHYSEFLKGISQQYSIERSVKVHVDVINSL